tara:strand:- start:278 stop:466 length:189 start_codon:yes stop_codon:yes gene_type:complete
MILKFFLFLTAILIVLKLNDIVIWEWEFIFLPLQIILIVGFLSAVLYIIMYRHNRNDNEKDE